jgi:superoxide dismutase, Cu-Zn family
MTRVHRVAIGVAAAVALAAVAVALHVTAAAAGAPFAHARLALADGTRIGTVRFWDDRRHGATVVKVKLAVPPAATAPGAFHGFHVHANNDPANGTGCVADPRQPSSTWFVSADGHLKHDPAEMHGGHAGDLPILYLDADGRAEARFTVDRIVPRELHGKAVILHAGADNFGNVPVGTAPDQYTANSPAATTKTMNTGNAGDRIACGVVG